MQKQVFGAIGSVDPDEWWREVEVNLRGPFLYAHATLPSMRAHQRGRIINVASSAGLQAMPLLSAYNVSKTALIRLSETLARETAADGISVFAIEPGLVRTSLSAYAQHAPEVTERAPQVQQWFQTMFAEGHDTPIERAVELVLRLAAGHADVLSGAYLRVTDDLDALVQQAMTQPRTARCTLRLQA